MARNTAKGASKKAQMNSLIDNMVASAGVAKGAFSFNMNIVEEIVAEFIENVKRDMNKIEGMLTTGGIQELRIDVNSSNDISVYGMDYLIYRARGVNGAFQSNGSVHSYSTLKPPITPIIQWIKDKQLITRNNSKFFADPVFDDMTTDEKIQQLAGAIRQNIFKYGIQSKGNFYDPNVDLLKQELNNRVASNLSSQVRVRIFNKYGDNVNNKK